MQIFAVISQPNPNTDRLAAVIEETFPQDHLKVSDDVWLVAGEGTPKEVSDKLGVSNGTNGSAIVVEVGAYFGFASRNIWNWIKVKGTQTGG